MRTRQITRWPASGFAKAKMVCIAEHIFQDGEWGIFEWRDPSDLRPL